MEQGHQSNDEFFTTFEYTPILGGYEEGITRRDPSPVIRANGRYYVWYSRATVDETGYYADVWCATSPDGWGWTEQALAVGKGGTGSWDENGVFTASTLVAEGKYYLFYTAVPKPFSQDPPTPTAIGIAIADSPDGPWTKFEGNPVLRPGPAGDFDSCRVDDSCLIVRGGKYWLYYKGRGRDLTPAQTKMGLAIAESPTGPYVKHSANPVVGSGHEVCVWPHREGVAALTAPTGPEGCTIQYSPDGVSFTVEAKVQPPLAPGPFRTDGYQDVPYGEGITWGISQRGSQSPRPFLERFDCDLRAPASS